MRSKDVSVSIILITLFSIDMLYQINIRNTTIFQSLLISTINAVLYTTIVWVAIRMDLAKATISFLALPYLFFIPGWLNNASAIIILPIFIYCTWKTITASSVASNKSITIDAIAAFVLILIWVNLSGAGGYGAQTQDYRMHNARLNDLINYSWPVHYAENKNLVYYLGYFIPAAALGKVTSYEFAEKSMYIWTVFGVVLSIQWIKYLSEWKYAVLVTVIFIFFGPIDLINIIYNTAQAATPLTSDFREIVPTMDHIDFNSSMHLNFFIGNFLSNTFQLYWSPQQIIAGWLGAALIMYLFLKNDTNKIIFIYSLLCLWAPMVMLALAPFIIMTAIICLAEYRWRELITFENTLGSIILLIPFIIFYLSGSTSSNLSVWITNAFTWGEHWDKYFIFNLSGWVIFSTVIFYKIRQEALKYRLWFYCLVFSFIAIQIRTFGEYSDLLCRGSAPLMFILLVYFLRAIKSYWLDNKKVAVIGLCFVLATGASSAIAHTLLALYLYGHKQAVGSVTDFANAYPNFGPDNSLFEQWLRRPLPESVHTK